MSDPIVYGFPRSTFVNIVRMVLTCKPSHIDPNTDEMENGECKLALILLTASCEVPASAQPSIKPKCPAQYDLVGTYCQNNSICDIVLAN